MLAASPLSAISIAVSAISLLGRLQPLLLETLEHEAINLVVYALFPSHRLWFGTAWRHECPMRAPRSTRFYPVLKNRYFAVRKPVMPQIGGGHARRHIVARYAPQRLARYPAHLLLHVEPEVRLPLRGVRSVACVAVVGKDGTDVSVEIDRKRGNGH